MGVLEFLSKAADMPPQFVDTVIFEKPEGHEEMLKLELKVKFIVVTSPLSKSVSGLFTVTEFPDVFNKIALTICRLSDCPEFLTTARATLGPDAIYTSSIVIPAEAHCVASVVLFSACACVLLVIEVIQLVTIRPTTNTTVIKSTEARNAEIPFITILYLRLVYIFSNYPIFWGFIKLSAFTTFM